MKSHLAAMVAMFVAGAGSAFAGEVTGRGDPIDKVTSGGTSICAFSGLEDADNHGPGDVQSFGRHPHEGSGVSDDPEANAPRGRAAPGFFCNQSGGEPS